MQFNLGVAWYTQSVVCWFGGYNQCLLGFFFIIILLRYFVIEILTGKIVMSSASVVQEKNYKFKLQKNVTIKYFHVVKETLGTLRHINCDSQRLQSFSKMHKKITYQPTLCESVCRNDHGHF